jgi:hypothetical protein
MQPTTTTTTTTTRGKYEWCFANKKMGKYE